MNEIAVLTGSTGTLGRKVLEKLLLETDYQIYCLIRPKSDVSIKERLINILKDIDCESYIEELSKPNSRISVVEASLDKNLLGLSENFLFNLDNVHLYHLAALTDMSASKEVSYSVNFTGTENVLKLAEYLHKNKKLSGLYYFSTAFITGSLKNYKSFEDTLPLNPKPSNFYEESKYKAEELIRNAISEGLSAIIFRPSIVVGDTKTGKISSSNIFYLTLKMFTSGLIKNIPTRKTSSINIVPIDFVINLSHQIIVSRNFFGKTFHLVSENPPTIQTFYDISEKFFPNIKPPTIVDPENFLDTNLPAREKMIYKSIEPFIGRLNCNLTFDMQNTKLALKEFNTELPSTDYDFVYKMLTYAIEREFITV